MSALQKSVSFFSASCYHYTNHLELKTSRSMQKLLTIFRQNFLLPAINKIYFEIR